MADILFVVSVDGDAPLGQRDAFTAYVRSLHEQCGVGFWHHLTSTWLISDSSGTLSAKQLRDQAKRIMPNVAILVLAIPGLQTVDWATLSHESGHEWLHKHIPAISRRN